MSVLDFRAEYRAHEISARYSGWAHFAFTTTGSWAVIIFAITRVDNPAWWELALVPVFFLVANAGEYFGHKGPMHHATRGLGVLYARHTKQHHQFFTAANMAADSPRDFKMVLFPPIMLFFFLGVLAGPIGALFFFILSENAGWLFVCTGVGYFLTYEWLHFAYHLPPDSLVSRLPMMATLRRHHTHHHDHRLMQRHNFNITFPICDRIFGTSYRGE